MIVRLLYMSLAACAVVLSAGCDDRDLNAPPQLRVGRDECAGCGMLIAEDRCAAAAIVEHGGVREALVFDDLGCLLDMERDPPERVRFLLRFARDYDARSWIDCESSTFAWTGDSGVHTPMGSGILAFAKSGAADAIVRSRDGGASMAVLTWPQVVERRTQLMHERFGTPGTKP